MSSCNLGKELDDLKAEYAAAEKMSEEEIQNEYNTDDNKEEFLSTSKKRLTTYNLDMMKP